MGPNHPIRHRVGILLVCLVALLLARDPWSRLPQIHPAQSSQTPTQGHPQNSLGPAQKFDFGFQSASAQEHDLQPFFSFLETPGLKCCDGDKSESPNDRAGHTRELNSRLNPNSFPQAEQFLPTSAGGGSTANPEEDGQAEEAYAGFVGNGPMGAWPPVLPTCASGLQNCDTTQQNPDPGLKIPEPGSLLLMLSGLSAILLLRFAKH